MTYKITNWLFFVMLFCAFGLPVVATATSTTTLVEWTFPNNPDNATADGGTPENILQTLTLIGASIPTYNNTGTTTFSARATGWQTGQSQKFWQVALDTRDFKDIQLSSKQRSSATGPRDFVIEYRIGTNGTWQTIPGGIVVLADNFTTGTLNNLSLPSECENQELVFIRFLMATNISVSGSAVTSTGSSRIDDVIIQGLPIEEVTDDSSPTSSCQATSSLVNFNEIFPYPSVSDQEYVELINQDAQCVDLSGWRIEDLSHHVFIIPGGTLINENQLLVFFHNFYLNNTSGETLYLYNAENELLSSLSYDRAIKDFAYSFDGSLFRFTSLITPGENNIFDEPVPEEDPDTTQTSNDILINEVLPNPKGSEIAGEYIELFNAGDSALNLKGWSIRDASRKKYTFTDNTTIAPKDYLLLPRTIFKFSLNNFGLEIVDLVDPQDKIISSVSFTDPKESLSYSRRKDTWRYTTHLTPGSENTFSKEPKIKIRSFKTGYVKTPLTFKASLEKNPSRKKLLYHWDFGDEHTSTLSEPKHIYQKTGHYPVTLRIKNADTDVEKTFTVNIKKYPRADIIISRLSPNPKGKDTGQEWIEINNRSRKTLDLKNWKIATGQERESLTNHPILSSLPIKSGEIIKLTHTQAAFSLQNAESIVELRLPDDTAMSAIHYQEDSIPEDAVCENIQGLCDFQVTESSPQEDSPAETPSISSSETQAPFFSLDTETPLDTPETTEHVSPPLSQKRELIHHIGQDINTLLNLYIQDWTNQL